MADWITVLVSSMPGSQTKWRIFLRSPFWKTHRILWICPSLPSLEMSRIRLFLSIFADCPSWISLSYTNTNYFQIFGVSRINADKARSFCQSSSFCKIFCCLLYFVSYKSGHPTLDSILNSWESLKSELYLDHLVELGRVINDAVLPHRLHDDITPPQLPVSLSLGLILSIRLPSLLPRRIRKREKLVSAQHWHFRLRIIKAK